MNKSLSRTVKRYSNIEREVTRYTKWAEKFHHHCFATGVSITTDHKPLDSIFKKDVATLSQRMQ